METYADQFVLQNSQSPGELKLFCFYPTCFALKVLVFTYELKKVSAQIYSLQLGFNIISKK